jgi:hypothetical protein
MGSLKENLDLIQKKAQERTVKTQTIEYDLETLVKKIEKKVIKLNPEYQRNHRWGDDTSSKLIESLILNIPIPLIYISQDVDVDEEVDEDIARYSVIDGQQRLTAIFKYFKNTYPLTGIEVLKELNGSFYKDLPPFLIRRLEERTISCLRIDSTVDAQVKYDIFERLNSGSVKLESQELRNATCRGPFNDLIKDLATDEHFVVVAQLDSGTTRVKTMEDQELVLRFFALAYNNGYSEYKGGFKSFLTEKMKVFNGFDYNKINSMRDMFLNTIKRIRMTFGDQPFAKYRFENGGYRRMSRFNAAVFDSVIVPFSKLANSNELKHLSHEEYKKLFKDPVFFSSVEGSVNDVAKLNTRLTKSSAVIK